MFSGNSRRSFPTAGNPGVLQLGTFLKHRYWRSFLVCAAMSGWSGCEGPALVEYTEYDDLFPVAGSIEFNGEPIPDATVRLHPVTCPAEGSLVHAPSGVVNGDGTFQVYTYRPEGRGRGAPPGEYRVTVSWRGPFEGLSESSIDQLKERLPRKYTRPATSPLMVSVIEQENIIPPISLK